MQPMAPAALKTALFILERREHETASTVEVGTFFRSEQFGLRDGSMRLPRIRLLGVRNQSKGWIEISPTHGLGDIFHRLARSLDQILVPHHTYSSMPGQFEHRLIESKVPGFRIRQGCGPLQNRRYVRHRMANDDSAGLWIEIIQDPLPLRRMGGGLLTGNGVDRVRFVQMRTQMPECH